MKSSGGLGTGKHRKSGTAPKSPKARLHMKIEAEKQTIQAKHYPMFDSPQEAFKKMK